MAERAIGGLFEDQVRGEAALAELQAAHFSSAQISEVADDDDPSRAPRKLGNPSSDFFKDHTTTGSEFRDNLAALGMPEGDARYFEDGVARGGALVTVKADSRLDEARAILERNGADLGAAQRERASTVATGTASTVAVGLSATGTDAASRLDDTAEQTVQLRAERLAVDKVRVASGAVRIRKRIVTEQQSVDVPVSHEELVIERHPVTGGAVGGTIGTDETITVPLSREEVTVGKQTFVTEEIDVGKRMVAGVANVSETLRHEELVVDGDEATADRSR